MVSTLSLEEKYSKIRRRLCFYLDIEDQELSRSLSRRLQDMGLQQEWVLSSRVTHAVVDGGGEGAGVTRRARGSRADAMLQRCAAPPPPAHARLSVRQAISLLDKLYDTFFAAPRKSHVKLFTKDFIKIEFLDKLWKPVYKEFDEFPAFSLEPDVPRDKRDRKQSPEVRPNDINQNLTNTSQKMTRKSRPRIKEKDEKEAKGGYCEMCHCDYTALEPHRLSAQHAGFARDASNFLALDSLIAAGADVATFLAKDAVGAERRSLRKLCNGDAEPRSKRPRRSQSPDSTVDGDPPRRRPFYRVVGVSTKLRSSGGFVNKKKESPPPPAAPLVVKFRKVRRSELSVLSDEAEQFMFPRRASSSSSTASSPAPPTPPAPPSPPAERRRLARPVALKEESSEDDSWGDCGRRRKRRGGVVAHRPRRQLPRRAFATAARAAEDDDDSLPSPPPLKQGQKSPSPPPAALAAVPESPPPAPAPPPAEPACSDGCVRWEDGRLRYPPAVERLQFAFECVPHSEPWFHSFRRQDENRPAIKNVPEFFALYSAESPKLPYEIGQLPPLKPNCCPLSELVRGAPRRGGRGGRGGRVAVGTRTLLRRPPARPRQSPREHASTLALLRRPAALAADAHSTASDDTGSDTLASLRRAALAAAAPSAAAPSAAARDAARLKDFLDDVFSDAAETVLEEAADAGAASVLAGNALDVPALVAAAEANDALREHMRAAAAPRRPRPRKTNRTGWPSKRRPKKSGSRAASSESRPRSDDEPASPASSSADDDPADPKTETESLESEDSLPLGKKKELTPPPREEKVLSPVKEEETPTKKEQSPMKKEETPTKKEESPTKKEESPTKKEESPTKKEESPMKKEESPTKKEESPTKKEKELAEEAASRRGKRRSAGSAWMQPVVRVQRVTVCARRLRSAARPRAARAR